MLTLGQSEVLYSAAPNGGNRGTAWERGNSVEQTDAKKPSLQNISLPLVSKSTSYKVPCNKL